MLALIDQRLCDSSPYCSALRSCPNGAISYDKAAKKVMVNSDRCGSCSGTCAGRCPMGAVKLASTMEKLLALRAEIEKGPSADELFEREFGVKPVDQRAEGVNLVHLSSSSFDAYVSQSDVPVAVDFWAAWCAPCKILAPTFKELAQEYEGRMRFAKVDTERNAALADRFGIRSIPTIGLFVRGQMVERSVGALAKGQLKSKLEAVLAGVLTKP
ncbi:MAG: thioredoxin [Chloroflexi bacterium]|nr:thioredoxin [Chloroflexota bacterium]